MVTRARTGVSGSNFIYAGDCNRNEALEESNEGIDQYQGVDSGAAALRVASTNPPALALWSLSN